MKGLLATSILGLLLASPSTAAVAADRDADGLRDDFEVAYGLTSPQRADSDRDGIIDSAEDEDGDKLGNLGEQRFGTDPGDPDSDADGVLDGDEDDDGDGRSNAHQQDQRAVPANLRPALEQADADNNLLNKWCSVSRGSWRVKTCHFGDPASDTTIVLMGDSHAHALLQPFKRSAQQEGWHLVTLIKGACVPLLGVGTVAQYELDRGQSCRRWRSAALDWMNQLDEPPDLVVLTSSDRYVLAGGQGGHVPKQEWPRLWKAGLERTIDALPNGTRALTLGDVPHNYGDPVRCLQQNRRDMSVCVSPRQDLAQRAIEVALREGAVARQASYGTLYESICTYDPCPLVQGDILMWRDRSHLSTTFSRRLTPAVRALLGETLR